MKLYRYSTNQFDSNNITHYHQGSHSAVYLHEYESIRETKCGVWILTGDKSKKFVNLTCMKQYASESVEEAKRGFLARKKRHLSILKSQIMMVEDSVSAIETIGVDYKFSTHQ